MKPIGGAVSDVVWRKRLAAGSLFFSGCLLMLLALVIEGQLAVATLVALFGMGLMVFPTITQAYLIESFSDESVGSAFGLSRTVYVLGGSLGPTIIGVSSELFNYDVTFAAFGVGLVVSAMLLYLIVPEDPHRRYRE